MSCICCFEDWVCACETEYIVINTRLTPGVTYYWTVKDKFDKVYQGSATAESDGTLQIPIADLPAGLFNEYAGEFKLTLSESVSCGTLQIPLAKKYDCILLTVKGGNTEKNTIGCEVPCAGGSGETVIIPFTDAENIEVDWSTYAETMGNNPLVQVYHEISENVYQMATVQVQQHRTNNILTSITVDNGGAATGYILITE